jgi:hypothetical protein
MLKSAATVVGIMLGSLAVSGLAVSPSEAQKLRTSVPCQPIIADKKCCKVGHIVVCRQFATRLPNGECKRETKCVRLNTRCGPRTEC